MTSIRVLRRGGVVLAVVSAMVILFAGTASAGSPSRPDPAKEKQAVQLEQQAREAIPPTGGFSAQWSKSLSKTKYGYCNNVSNGVRSNLSDSISYGMISADASGNSGTYWFGSNPYNANSMTLGDRYQYHGIAVSISVPAGAGFSAGGSTATWSYTKYNAWYHTHSYSGIHGSGGFTSYERSTTGNFNFTNTSCTVIANGEVWLT